MAVVGFYIGVFFCVTACISTQRVEYEDSEGEIPRHFLARVTKDVTSQTEIVDFLGEPYGQMTAPRGFEMYTYRFTRSEYKHLNVLIFFVKKDFERDTRYYHVIFDNGRVKRAWLDRSPKPDLAYQFGQYQAMIDAKKGRGGWFSWLGALWGKKQP